MPKYKDQGLGTSTNQQPISVKFPPEVDSLLRSLPNRSDLIRQYVIEGLKRDGKLENETQTSKPLWNVYEAIENYDGTLKDWVLVGSYKSEYEADQTILERKQYNHEVNSRNDCGIVALRWEKRHEG